MAASVNYAPRAVIHTPLVAGYGTEQVCNRYIWGIAGRGTSIEQVWNRYGTNRYGTSMEQMERKM